jgi:hypothetical protein
MIERFCASVTSYMNDSIIPWDSSTAYQFLYIPFALLKNSTQRVQRHIQAPKSEELNEQDKETHIYKPLGKLIPQSLSFLIIEDRGHLPYLHCTSFNKYLITTKCQASYLLGAEDSYSSTEKNPHLTSFFFLAVLGLELRASLLLGRALPLEPFLQQESSS